MFGKMKPCKGMQRLGSHKAVVTGVSVRANGPHEARGTRGPPATCPEASNPAGNPDSYTFGYVTELFTVLTSEESDESRKLPRLIALPSPAVTVSGRWTWVQSKSTPLDAMLFSNSYRTQTQGLIKFL